MYPEDYMILYQRYLRLEVRYKWLKEGVRKFLKRKSGYKELRKLLKELPDP